jgi:hypothetical protein
LAVSDAMVDAVGAGLVVWTRDLYALALPANIASAAQTAIPVSNDFVMIVPSLRDATPRRRRCASMQPLSHGT